jgi:hypothetical protein
MGKFLLGLILGVVLGVAATAYHPNPPEDVRVALANLTALVMRGTERAAAAAGGAADRTAAEAGKAPRKASARRLGSRVQPSGNRPSDNPPPASR